jgi:hypothetical protein
MDTFTPVLSRNVSWFLFRFLITAAVCACVCVCLYTGSSPPTGPSSLLTYFTQNVAAVSANTGASVSNGLNSLIDAGSSLIKGVLVFLVIRVSVGCRKPACLSVVLRSGLCSGGNSKAKLSMNGVNVELDENLKRFDKVLTQISKLGAHMEAILQVDNAKLFEMSQFSYYLKQLSELDNTAAAANTLTAESPLDSPVGTQLISNINVDEHVASPSSSPTKDADAIRYAHFNRICNETAQAIDNVAMSQQKLLEIQNFKCKDPLQYLGRYSVALNACMKQRDDVVAAIETATQDRTARKEQLDAGSDSL